MHLNVLIDRFLTNQKADDVAGMRIVGNTIARRLMLHHNDLFIDAARQILEGLDDFFRFGERHHDDPTNIYLPAGQQAAFIPGLIKVNKHLQSVNIPAILVCDEDHQFGEVLKQAFERMRNAEDHPYLWEFGATESLTNIVDIEQVTSDDSFGVQLADLAAGLANRLAMARIHTRRLTIQQRRVVTAWRPSFAPSKEPLFHGFRCDLEVGLAKPILRMNLARQTYSKIPVE